MDVQNELYMTWLLLGQTRNSKGTTNLCQSDLLKTSHYSSGNKSLYAPYLRANTNPSNKVHGKIKLPSAENKSLKVSDLRAKNIEIKAQNKLKSPLPPQ